MRNKSLQFWLGLGAALIFGWGAVHAQSPTLTITSPTSTENVVGTSVVAKLSLTDFTLVDYQTHSRNLASQGHIHLWLDQEAPTKASAVKIVEDSYTFENVRPGNHHLVAELVNNDHSSLTPPVVTEVDFATIPMPTPTPNLLTSPVFTTSVLAFLLLVVALYFINTQVKTTQHSGKPKQKSGRKSATRRRQK
jgi:hypothetical protein